MLYQIIQTIITPQEYSLLSFDFFKPLHLCLQLIDLIQDRKSRRICPSFDIISHLCCRINTLLVCTIEFLYGQFKVFFSITPNTINTIPY